MKASALRLLDPFYDQFSVLYRGLVIQFLLNSSFIIKYDVIFDNICYTISSYVSSLMGREGFRLENRVKPFDTGIICYFASFLRILTLLFPAIKVERLTPKHSKIIDTGQRWSLLAIGSALPCTRAEDSRESPHSPCHLSGEI